MNENNVKQKRVAIYLRVSTDDQAKEGRYGLAVQEERCRSYCESQGYKVDENHVYSDDISGALEEKHRPALNKLFEAIENKEIDVVVALRVDRIARDIRVLSNIIHKLNQSNVDFQSVSEPFDTTTPAGRVNMNMLGSFAQFERDMIRERTMNGKLKSAKTGNWVTGIPPYAYKVSKEKKLEMIPEQAKVVKMMYKWLVTERLPLREIERRLNKKNIPPPYSTKTRKTNMHWYRRTIGRILTNEVYTGTFVYRKYKRPFNNLTSTIDPEKQRPEDEWVEIQTPAIISKEMFGAAKKQLVENRKGSIRNQKRTYLYSKLIHCGKCGYKLFSRYQPPRKRQSVESNIGRYYSGVFRNQHEPGNTNRCEWCGQYAESRLEPIWECLKEILKEPKHMMRPLERYALGEESQKEINQRIKEIKKELEKIQEKRRRAEYLYINNTDHMSEERLRECDTEFKKEEGRLNNEMEKLKEKMLTKQEKKDREKTVWQLHEQLKDKIDNVSYEEKAQIVQIFVKRITLFIDEDYAEIVFRFPKDKIAITKFYGNKRVSQKQSEAHSLVLRIKTMSEYERQVEIIKNNPLMGTSRVN